MDYLNLLEKRTIRGAGKKQEGTAPQTAEKTDGPAPVQRTGLSAAEVEQLRKRYGLNKLEGKKKKSAAVLFLSQFKDVLVLILIVSAVLSMMMGEMTEAVTILIIIGVNAVIGAVQEFRTEKTIEALEKLSAPVCRVLRDGQHASVPCEQLVPGDLVLLEAGNRVPADGALLEENGISIDESVLTGESAPLMKAVGEPVFSGTLITRGHGLMRVDAIGMDTEMGGIAGMLGEIEEEPTPLQRRLSELGKYIGIGCLVICAVVAVTGILRGEPVFSMLVTGLSLAVAAVPEGLPAIVTIALALAVGKILKKGAVIKKLHAVETLGCATVICSDKTGTLTENRMTVTRLRTLDSDLVLSGDNVESRTGELRLTKSDRFFIESLYLCNNATEEEGEPTELALLRAALVCGVQPEEVSGRFPRLSERPFDSERKRMSVTVRTPEGTQVSICKGAPDRLLSACRYAVKGDRIIPLTGTIREEIRRMNDSMADAALRVLACGYRLLRGPDDDPESGLVFLGLAGMVDPPRPEVKDAVRACRRAGIRPVMITGDYKNTAAAIAKQTGILKDGDLVLTGDELDAMSDEQLKEKLPRVAVFARVSPAHKLKVVRALKKRGDVVAMTGDGVNDAPAIKEADIGVCMGKTGTDVSKEAASIILLEDSFSVIVSAVLEGRVIYANIRKFIRYLLACNTGEVLTMFVGMLMGLPVVLLPIQILLINLVTDGLPATALGMDPGEKDILEKRPRKPSDGVFSDGLAAKILFRGCLIALATLGTFVSVAKYGGDLSACRTAAFLTLVFTQLVHVFECKSETKTLLHIPLFNNIWLILACMLSLGAVLAAVYVPWCQGVFSTVALSIRQMGIVLAYTAGVPVLGGLVHRLLFSGKKG